MRISTQYTIIDSEKNSIVSKIGTGYDIEENTNCEQFKKIITESIGMLSIFNVEKQEIKTEGVLIEDSDIITKKSYKCTYYVTKKVPEGYLKPETPEK